MPKKKAEQPVVVATVVAAPPTKKRAKRQWSTYNQFVHDHYSDPSVQAAKVRERLKIIAKLWAEHKENLTK
jgi:hypothetical protein